MSGRRTMERRKLRRRTGWALLFSLLAHLLIILTAAWFTILGLEPAPEPVEEIEITIIQPPPAPQKPQFVDTSAPEAAKPPEDALFESDRDTAAAAPEAAAGAEPLPSQDGRKQDFLELEQQELALAKVDVAPPAPETPPAEPAPPEPPQPEERQETRSKEEKPEPVEADALLASAQPEKKEEPLERKPPPAPPPSRPSYQRQARPTRLSGSVSNRGKSAVEVAAVANGFGAVVACEAAGALAPGASRNCSKTVTVPADARLTAAHFHTGTQGARYVFDADVPFGLPFRPTPYTATFTMTVDNTPFTITLPIQARTDTDIFAGEKRQEITVVPAFAVATTPDTVIVPLKSATPISKDVRVTVTNHAKGAATADVMLEIPQGWRVTPPTQPVSFSREDESATVRFALQPPAAAVLASAAMKPGGNQFKVNAVVKSGTGTFNQGYQVVEYPHTTRRHVLSAPQVVVKALDVNVKPNLSLGYVMGVGDEVPAALIQLGVKLTLINAEELAWGDLSHYDVIMTGVRAYERRVDLRANNQRLLDYAKAGGTVIVQYNKFEFNDAQYGPFAAKVGRERVTDENAEMKLLQPQHPVFNTPNAIGRADWAGWVQERGLYFLDEAGRDPQYQDLIEFAEPFAYNKGAKRGALVEAKVGQGRWLYVGIGLWRQLPAGTDGAFRLMANLISLSGPR